ncbi:hypothetical protein PRZ48_011612 [Zasmidium cellare]|uniref:Uncharacterized protein n=1 Tax=Zasmidium cellare TaxID=395010 RepID=A0ABR0E6U7_ZASCE|nr:hypothetical protein PRZ48_011612 [Zasmidium cellare]
MASDNDLKTVAPTSKMKKNPQACFTGLPAELRVRIYGFVFSGVWMKEKKEKSALHQITVAEEQEGVQTQGKREVGDLNGEGAADVETNPQEKRPHMHCCNRIRRIRTSRGIYTVPTTCTCCFGHLNPAILSTNRLIYKEALPVFYGNIEVRFSLPLYWSPCEPADHVRWTLAPLPQTRLPMISRMVYTQVPSGTGYGEEYPPSSDFEQLWEFVEKGLPNLKHVRIHFDLYLSLHVREHLFRDLAGATRLPKLKTMEIELSCTGFREPVEDGDECKEKIAGLQEDFVASIKSEAERLGKKIEVKVC